MLILFSSETGRHIYSDAGGECVGIRLVSSQAVAVRGPVLDGRFDGDDDTQCVGTGIALRLGHYALSTGADHNGGVLGHDVELDVLGTAK